MATNAEATFWERFKGRAFHLFPHHWLSRLTYRLARLETPLKDPLVRAYVRFFKVNMQEAETSRIEDYTSFNHFFTRALRPDAREVCDEPDALISPCDGTISQIGDLEEGLLLQAKGRYYRAEELLGGAHPRAKEDARGFSSGKFCSIYIAPGDYHRVHAPADLQLNTMIHVPGRLFSVAAYAAKVIPNLYARNERVASIFESDLGRVAVVLVGALNVGSIETVWGGQITPKTLSVTRTDYSSGSPAPDVNLKRGEELGRFSMGSCVVLLVDNPKLSWNPMHTPGRRVRMGEELGRVVADGETAQSTEKPVFTPVDAQ